MLSRGGLRPTRRRSYDRGVEIDQAKVRYLLPGIRRGFLLSAVPIVLLGVVFAANDVGGGLAWAVGRAVLAIVLFAVVVRLGDGRDDPQRTLRLLAWVMVASSAGWGALGPMIDSSELEWQAIVVVALVSNLAIVTIQSAADLRVFLAAVVPVSALGLIGLLIRADGELVLPVLFALGAPYSFALFASSHRALMEGFEMERRNEVLLLELEERQRELSDTNARLKESAAQQTTLLDERAALLSTVGHDLGSPLGAAMLTAEILAERPDAISPSMQRELAGRIKAQVHDALTVLRDLTASQRLDRTAAGEQRLEVDLEAMVDVVAARHRDHGHTIVNTVPEAMLAWADPGLLDRMLDNLVGNAVKYTPASSTIEVGAEPDTGPASDGAGEGVGGVIVWVDDDGPGLPADLRGEVFDEYVRGPSSTSGTGVGLHLVRTFAQSHGGEVSWQPSDRGGSRFEIRLPGRPVAEHPMLQMHRPADATSGHVP